jgi:diguanylate cyclase (GGDEF)-like protein/PAS domain S-box-containing protein
VREGQAHRPDRGLVALSVTRGACQREYRLLIPLSVLPYFLLLIIASGLCASLALVAWRHRGVPGSIALSAMLVAIVIWCLGYSFELVSISVQMKLFWCKVQYFGVEVVILAWLAFALQYTGQDRWLRTRGALALGIEPVITWALSWTNEAHGLMWSYIKVDETGAFRALLLSHGPWFWVHSIYSYALLVISAAALVWSVLHSRELYRQQTRAAVIAVAAPWLANALYLSGLSPVPQLDPTPFGFTIAGLTLSWGLLRLRLLSLFPGLVPVAHDAILEGMGDGVIVLDQDNRIADLNPAARRIVGSSSLEMIGETAESALTGRAELVSLFRSDVSDYHAEIAVGEAGERHHYDLLVSALRGQDGGQRGRLAVLRDITERKRAEDAVQHQAFHDSLTDLPNRNLLQERLRQSVLSAERDGKPCALVMMDLDRFKEVNDTFGHQSGDLLLQQVGRRLLGAVRDTDLIARLGGDEFAVLLNEVTAEDAIRATQRLIQTLERAFVVQGYRLDVAVSAGIALCPDHGTDADILLRRADVAMYVAKRAGAGYSVYSAEQDPYSPERLLLLSELRPAIDHNELTLYYQPQVELKTGMVVQLEALVRWQHRRLGMVPPGVFIPLAENTGLIKPLTGWVLRQAARQHHEWLQAGLCLPVAVNLAARCLHDAELAGQIAALLETWDIEPGCLAVEITESSLMDDPARALLTLTELSELGVRVSVDDFGTGYSSLNYLARLPVHEIKIDQSFVMHMTTVAKDSAIVRSTINLGHDLDLTVVAEGVEDQASWDLLGDLGCDVAQGYFMSRPIPGSDVARWLGDSRYGMAGPGGRVAPGRAVVGSGR